LHDDTDNTAFINGGPLTRSGNANQGVINFDNFNREPCSTTRSPTCPFRRN